MHYAIITRRTIKKRSRTLKTLCCGPPHNPTLSLVEKYQFLYIFQQLTATKLKSITIFESETLMCIIGQKIAIKKKEKKTYVNYLKKTSKVLILYANSAFSRDSYRKLISYRIKTVFEYFLNDQ